MSGSNSPLESMCMQQPSTSGSPTTPQGIQMDGLEMGAADGGTALEVCEILVRSLDPVYRERYLSGQYSPRTKKKTKQLQGLILSMLKRGPIRDCIEELAQRRVNREKFDRVKRNFTANRADHEDCGEQPLPLGAVACDLFTLANEDDDFMFLCSLFDKEIERDFPAIVGAWVQVYRAYKRNRNMTHLMRDVLEHAEGRCYGVTNPDEHEKREMALLCLSKIACTARETFGLTSYSEIRRENE